MRSRHTPIILTTAALLGATMLSGCTQAQTVTGCVPTLGAGALVNNIEVHGGFDEAPQLTIPSGFSYANAQVATTDRASDRSRELTEPSVVTLNYALFESTTGMILEQSTGFATGQGSDFLPASPGVAQGAFVDALTCAAPGDRLVAVLTPGEATAIAGSIGMPETTVLSVLIDVHDVRPEHLPGRAQNLPSGFPGVITDSTGQPGVVAVPGAAPTQTRVATRIDGDGKTVEPSDLVVAHVLELTWQGTLISNTRDNSMPMSLGTAEQPAIDVRDLIDGASVGSQLVVLMPDTENDARVVVIDVLAAG